MSYRFRFGGALVLLASFAPLACTSSDGAPPKITQLTARATGGPSIQSVTGDIRHGATISVSGSGFGTKSTATPLIFDTMESGSLSSSWASVGDLTVNSTNNRSAFSTRNGHLNFVGGSDTARLTAGDAVYPNWFVQYWFMLAPNWDWGTTGYDGADRFLSNIKVFRMWNPGSTTENFVVAYAGWVDNFIHDVENTSDTKVTYFGGPVSSRITRGVWHLLQFEYAENSDLHQADGRFRAWLDGQLITERSDMVTRETFSGFKRPFIVGWDSVWGPNSDLGETDDGPNDFYIDDVYVDNSWARLELGDAPVYANCTHREVQSPVAWSDGSITAQVNQGSFADGSPVYLFVVDAQGNASPGFALTVGSSTSTGSGPEAGMTGTTLINEDFSGPDFTFVAGGTWQITGGQLRLSNFASATPHGNIAVHNTTVSGDFTLTATGGALATDNTWNDISVLFGYQDPNNYYFYSLNERNDSMTSGIFRYQNGVMTELADITVPLVAGVSHDLRLERQGSTIRAFLDGTLVATANDSTFMSGKVGFGTRDDDAFFDNLRVQQ